MIPPLLLDAKPGHTFFDTCAAPGSKTAQLLEFLLSDFKNPKDRLLSTGFIIANDADNKRANLLAHQSSRFNSGAIAIVNHNAVNFPTLHYQPGTQSYEDLPSGKVDSKILFDRVLCDVPCSSDAAIRKIPQKWESWDPKDGASLHPLQLRILLRGLQLLKPGGILSYSTCSLSPIENEAVVAEALRSTGGQFEILDQRHKLGSFKTRKGLASWKVYDTTGKRLSRKKREEKEEEKAGEKGEEVHTVEKYFTVYEKYADVEEEKREVITESMFPPMGREEMESELNISRCIRVFPHD